MFAEVKEMEKIFKDNRISDADILSFSSCDCLESDLWLETKKIYLWEQLKSGKLHMILSLETTWLAYLDCEAFGADKGKEVGAYNGFKDSDDEEYEDVEDDQAEEAGSAAGQEPRWGLQ